MAATLLNRPQLAAVVTLFWDWGESNKGAGISVFLLTALSDAVTHFDDEVEYIWKRDWRMAGKPMYLVSGPIRQLITSCRSQVLGSS